MATVIYEVPRLDQFILFSEANGDVTMECQICAQDYQVTTLDDAISAWNEHTCKER